MGDLYGMYIGEDWRSAIKVTMNISHFRAVGGGDLYGMYIGEDWRSAIKVTMNISHIRAVGDLYGMYIGRTGGLPSR